MLDDYREILDALPEADRQRLAQKLQEAENTQNELQSFVAKAYSNPNTKKKLVEVINEVRPDLEVPQAPFEPYISQLQDELHSIKSSLDFKDAQSKARELMERYNLTKEEAKDIDEFAKQNNITNPLSAMELYGELKRSSSAGTEVSVENPVAEMFKNPTSLEEAKKVAVEALRQNFTWR